MTTIKSETSPIRLRSAVSLSVTAGVSGNAGLATFSAAPIRLRGAVASPVAPTVIAPSIVFSSRTADALRATTLAGYFVHFKSPADTAAPVDVFGRIVQFYRTWTDAGSITDTAAAVTGKLRADHALVSDATAAGLAKAGADAPVASDDFVWAGRKLLRDSGSARDTLVREAAFTRLWYDALRATDTFLKSTNYNRSATDTGGGTDTSVWATAKSLSDTTTTGDVLERVAAFHRYAADTSTVTSHEVKWFDKKYVDMLTYTEQADHEIGKAKGDAVAAADHGNLFMSGYATAGYFESDYVGVSVDF